MYKGIPFDSILERNSYRRLESLKVKFTYHERYYIISESFDAMSWNSKTKKVYKSKIAYRKYTPEFVILDKGREIIIEMKGRRTSLFNFRWDIFRKQLTKNQQAYLITSVADLSKLIKALGIEHTVYQPNIKL